MYTYGIVLAAGRGLRMDSTVPKPAIVVDGKPIIERIVDSLVHPFVDENIVVVGYKKEFIKNILKDRVRYVIQNELTGTATAVKEVAPVLQGDSRVIILPGDIPYINPETIGAIIDYHTQSGNDLTVVSMYLQDPTGFGRIIHVDGRFVRIVEERDATPAEKGIHEVNTGIIVAKTGLIKENIGKITNNNQKGEYYLTDIVEIVLKDYKVGSYFIRNSLVVMGANDKDTLDKLIKKVNKCWQKSENVVK
jgi:bifunctional UDP-N-acetylglucosamine pyrophosphorylase/glucosamine-1-phosphate N-acetyltransferase